MLALAMTAIYYPVLHNHHQVRLILHVLSPVRNSSHNTESGVTELVVKIAGHHQHQLVTLPGPIGEKVSNTSRGRDGICKLAAFKQQPLHNCFV